MWHPSSLFSSQVPENPRELLSHSQAGVRSDITDPHPSAQEVNEGPHNRIRFWLREINLHRFHLNTQRLWGAPKPHAVTSVQPTPI